VVTWLVDADEYSFSWLFSSADVVTMSRCCEQDQPSDFLVQRPMGKMRSFMADEIDDVVFDACSVVQVMPTGLVEADVDFLFLLASADHAVVDAHFVGFSVTWCRVRAACP